MISLSDLPAGTDSGGYVYAVEFASGEVEIHHTTNPRIVFNRYRSTEKVTRFWLSPLHEDFSWTFNSAMEFAHRAAGCMVTEIRFMVLPLACVVGWIESLAGPGKMYVMDA